ncbi:hypothetical protein [Galbibacter pacificus]|uniref:Uncharacterized protein n=1 Tax=Galbibacter pacificus TaxID=2996052 RepID=A0ABT6FP67_9FLAO|nr:hypothetical protein [Galbibacter pacificus]MDG3581571.1 hypothetical protein [Galbibacter pacificus]MDG3585049.1 hypothetical protein [Galbibacter pacificus]
MMLSGYDEKKINEGKVLLKGTEDATRNQTRKSIELSAASSEFKRLKKQVTEFYKEQRAKAKIVFEEDGNAMDELGINRPVPSKYAQWQDSVAQFYETLYTSTALQKKIAGIGIKKEDIISAIDYVTLLKNKYIDYIEIKGVKEDATKDRNKIFDKLNRWMHSFYVVAEIQLKEHPQLLESLDKRVKS